MMTKSLHTVTAVSRVALLFAKLHCEAGRDYVPPANHVSCALNTLGYADEERTDPTIAACIKATAKAMKAAGLYVAEQHQ